MYLRIKRERVSGFQRDIKAFVAAFYVMITGIFRFGVNDCKLVDSFFDLVKEVGIIHHVGGWYFAHEEDIMKWLFGEHE